MRMPITVLLLLAFLAVQLRAVGSLPGRVAGAATWRRLLAVPTALTAADGETYLVGTEAAWSVSTTGGRLAVRNVPTRWLEVPEPSGQGVWRVLTRPNRQPLLALGGTMRPAPTGRQAAWIDPGTGSLFVSASGTTLTSPPVAGLVALGVRWPDPSLAPLTWGDGPNGPGVYWVNASGHAIAALLVRAAQVLSAGATPTGRVVAVLNDGDVLVEGDTTPLFEGTAAAWTASTGAVLAIGPRGSAALWLEGHPAQSLGMVPMPTASPVFSPNGREAAYVAQVGRHQEVVLVSTHGVRERLTGDNVAVTGFLGEDVVVDILSGPSQGTYLWVPEEATAHATKSVELT